MATLEDLQKSGARVRAAEQELEVARGARDDLIRDVRLSTKHTVPAIAEAAGVSLATVKTVIRGLRQ
ncbi:hypothetical protein [Actinoplanes sp. TFC3]|uniref:hypothetical protein n=1 Tax=Actinoplanes sp. TFC3 TaxID=1710355 RepID=UPI000B2130DD|nr:hypothetical protein [Actinoplanes sp. TFC3]